jgi:enterochelin esterase-like enzyme
MDKRKRYRLDTFSAPSLEGNPLGSPVRRNIHIYLPPGYFDSEKARYPVVYFLHGYGADSGSPVVNSRKGLRHSYPLLLRVPFKKYFTEVATFEKLDGLILTGALPPFILVQPDGSLHQPNIYHAKGLDGKVGTKGSLFTDSPFSGNYATYVFEEVLGYVEPNYRTIGEKSGRYLIGGSMGGYGALLGGILHPSLFAAIAALSPSICCLDLLDLRFVVPFNRILFGEAKAEEMGRRELGDILDTCDLVFSKDRPLLPTIKRDEQERVVQMDERARENWARADLGYLLDRHPDAFDGVRLQLNCAQADEFGFAEPCRRFHSQLEERGIQHSFEIYSDPKAERISPHILGVAWHVLPALNFCLRSNPGGGFSGVGHPDSSTGSTI